VLRGWWFWYLWLLEACEGRWGELGSEAVAVPAAGGSAALWLSVSSELCQPFVTFSRYLFSHLCALIAGSELSLRRRSGQASARFGLRWPTEVPSNPYRSVKMLLQQGVRTERRRNGKGRALGCELRCSLALTLPCIAYSPWRSRLCPPWAPETGLGGGDKRLGITESQNHRITE